MAIRNIRYYIDPETGLPHIYNHDVIEDEVEQVLAKPGEDRQGDEGSRVAIGQTEVGRYLRVIYTRHGHKVRFLGYNNSGLVTPSLHSGQALSGLVP